MTAIIGVLNKTTVALAADSAATVGPNGNSKVYNHANKIFNLTHNNPVAIAIYGIDEVMGVPWETIIKMYRKQFSHAGFSTLEEYGKDFLSFLQSLLAKHVSAEEQVSVARLIIKSVIQEVNTDWKSRIENNKDRQTEIDPNNHFAEELLASIKQVTTNISQMWGSLPGFDSYTLADFQTAYSAIVQEEASSILKDISFSPDHLANLNILAHMMIGGGFFYELTTGIVISGFGEDEIYPSLIGYIVGGFVENIARFKIERTSVITNKLPVDVQPFAQTDSIWAFLNGINPAMQERVIDLMGITLAKFSQRVLDKLDSLALPAQEKQDGGEVPSESNRVLSAEQTAQLSQEFEEAASGLIANLQQEIQQTTMEENYIPILRTIISLSKEDLAEMAESLINLTYLQRRMSFSQESVGGPIDVALITKGDGFVWIKRKHYFKPESNLNYLARVIKKQ